MHLTNYAINKTNESFQHSNSEEILVSNKGTKRTLTSLYDTLEQRGIDVDTLKVSIKQTCSKVMQIYGPMIEH